MLTLHKTVETTKKVFRWSVIVSSAILLLVLSLNGYKWLVEYIRPTPPPPPTVLFGKLPVVLFPQSSRSEQFTYTIDTLTGLLPSFPDRVRVQKLIKKVPSLLDLKKAKEDVSQIGFVGPEVKITDVVYQWDSTGGLASSIQMDIVSRSFTLTSQFHNDDAVGAALNLPPPDEATDIAQSFFQSLSSFPSDINQARTKTTLLSIQDNEVVQATSLATAQLIRVDFFQNNYNQLPIYYPKPSTSTIHAVIAGNDRFKPYIVDAKYVHKAVSEIGSTYPVKTAQQAFKELQEGKAYIAEYFGNTTDVKINNMLLAYFISDRDQDFLMPIIVFEGKNGFFAYLPAITDQWLDSSLPTSSGVENLGQ